MPRLERFACVLLSHTEKLIKCHQKNSKTHKFLLTTENSCVIINNHKYKLISKFIFAEDFPMSRIKTIETKDIAKTVNNGGCGECQTSCQSACKTSCGVANQKCENTNK